MSNGEPKTIKPIETVYNGYRFRSRLEARWAVFFDALGIEYEYEPEGYEYGEDEEMGIKPYRWLPDFRLTSEDNLLVEVKGSDGQLKNDWDKLSIAVDFHSTPASEGLLILGDIPNPNDVGFGAVPIFSYLEWYKGVKCDYAAFVDNAADGHHVVRGRDALHYYVYSYEGDKIEACYATGGFGYMPSCVTTKVRIPRLLSNEFTNLKAAYAKARQARFEFGETPKA